LHNLERVRSLSALRSLFVTPFSHDVLDLEASSFTMAHFH